MSKKIKILFGVGVALVLLVTCVTVPIMAHDTPTPAANVNEDFLERIAQILGGTITREKIVAAFKAAREELKGATPSPTPEAAKEKVGSLFGKVAQKLGVTKEALVLAFQQVAKEFRATKMENALDKAVSRGVITSEEKMQIETWFASRPEAVDKLLNLRGFCRWIKGRSLAGVKNQVREQLKERIKIQAKGQIKNRLSLPRKLESTNVQRTSST